MEEIRLIRPKEMSIYYDFTKDECYEVLSGSCSLDEPFNQKNFEKVTGKRCHKTYCQRLSLAVKASKVMFDRPVEIQKYTCNHFDVSDGRHRICICKKIDLPILANISTEEDKCFKCSETSSGTKNNEVTEFTVFEVK